MCPICSGAPFELDNYKFSLNIQKLVACIYLYRNVSFKLLHVLITAGICMQCYVSCITIFSYLFYRAAGLEYAEAAVPGSACAADTLSGM